METDSGNHGQARATAAGLVAIGLWSGLALSTVAAAGIPPFQLLAMSFAVAFVSGMIVLAARGRQAVARLRQPIPPWLLAFGAIFLYHALYFYALSQVPAARASLIAYLWPLLIVVFSARGAGVPPRHLTGAALGFLGAALIFAARSSPTPTQNALGYLAALGCAVIWSGYSVANRRYAHIPTEMLIGVCGGVALAGLGAHLALERMVMPTPAQALAVLFLGIGPVGLAFLAWDHATKHGNMPLLGALSYLAPMISTLLLVATGEVPASLMLGLSAALIVAGAVIAGSGSGRDPNAAAPGKTAPSRARHPAPRDR